MASRLPSGWGLAARFALASGTRFRARVAVASGLALLAVLLGFAAVSVVAGFAHTITVAESRARIFVDDEADASALVRSESIWLDGKNIEFLSIAPVNGRTATPPGLDRLPRSGTYAVSPALADEIAASPALHRLMPVDAVIAPEGVATGGELYAVRQVPADLFDARDPVYVSGFGTGPAAPPYTFALVPLWAPAVACLVLLILPAVLLLATGAKLSSAVREHRVKLMFRLGARASAIRLAAMESVLMALPGVLIATLLWLAWLGRLERVPFVGSPLLDGAWAFGWPHVAVVCGSLAVTAAAVSALTRPRSQTKVATGEERVRRARLLPAGIGVAGLLVTPWISSGSRGTLFLVAVTVSAIGVCLALPLWFQRSGVDLRSRRAFPLFVTGARLARFPRTHARGWAMMAAACALVGPLLVLVDLNARGDTDVQQVPPSTISRFVLQLESDDLAGLQRRLPGMSLSWAHEETPDGSPQLSGSCEEAARRLGLADCRALSAELGSARTVTFRGDTSTPTDHRVSVLARRDARPLDALARASATTPFHALTESTTPYVQSSPMVPWLLTGMGIAVLAAMMSIGALVIDRSMMARDVDSLERIGLSLRRRRRVDATTFLVSCLLASGAGMALGMLSAIVLSRDEFAGLFPWKGLLTLLVGIATVAVAGAAVVATGSNRAVAVTDRPRPALRTAARSPGPR